MAVLNHNVASAAAAAVPRSINWSNLSVLDPTIELLPDLLKGCATCLEIENLSEAGGGVFERSWHPLHVVDKPPI